MNLRTPGPTPCPEDVLQAGAKPMINHRGPEFKELIYRITDSLKRAFDTKNDLYVLSTSGTGGMETAVVSTMSPGDKALLVTIGVFGDRFGQIAETYGARVSKIQVPWGKAVEPDQVRQALKADPEIKAVLITHNETSTGVTNDLEAVAKVVKDEFGLLLLVDAVSSLGCIPLPVDKWRCDVVVTASQKGWMVPPGLAFISFSEQAWQAHSKAQMPRFYFDISKAKSYHEIGQTPWTPALPVIYGLDLALDKMLAEGMPNVFRRHAQIGQMTREGVKALGLSLFADEAVASDTVTAVNVPPGVDGKKLVDILREEYQVVLAGGQQSMAGKIFRIGHLGYCTSEDIQGVLDALQEVLPRVGFTPSKAGARGRNQQCPES